MNPHTTSEPLIDKVSTNTITLPKIGAEMQERGSTHQVSPDGSGNDLV